VPNAGGTCRLVGVVCLVFFSNGLLASRVSVALNRRRRVLRVLARVESRVKDLLKVVMVVEELEEVGRKVVELVERCRDLKGVV